MAKEFRISKGRLEELKEELKFLKTVREKEIAAQIKEARSFGDLSENSEYDVAKTEQGKLYSKIAEIENIITNAVIIEDHNNINAVGIGSRVKVSDVEAGGFEEYLIVGSQEANPMVGKISEDSPFGSSLIGCKAGDIVTVDAPDGVLKFRIEEISR